jgi:hypothetical protein
VTHLDPGSCLALTFLVSLLILLGSRFGGLVSERDSGAFRLVIAALAGVVVLYLLLTVLDALRIRWHPLVIVGLLGGAIVAAHRFLRSPPAALVPAGNPAARLGWGDAAAAVAIAAFARYAESMCIVIADFFFHWGIKAERFFLARGTDYAFLALSWNWQLRPDYPNLLPDLYACTAILAGRFAAPTMMLWSVGFFLLLLLAGREALIQAGTERLVAQATLAVTALAAAAAGMRGNMAGGADWMISLAIVAALPPLLRPADRAGNAQVGVAAAFAAVAKVEGTALAAFLIGVQLVRAAAGMRRERRIDGRSLAALVLPAAAVVLPWQIQVRRLHFSPGVYGGFDLRHAEAIAAALRYELTASPTWHGFAFALLLLPLLGFRRRLRPLGTVLALQLAFYMYVYFSFRFDPVPLVITSFDRLELHLLPPLLLASGIALDPFLRLRRPASAPAPGSAGAT